MANLFRIQRFNQTVQVPANADSANGADVVQLNGMLRSLSVLAPALDGVNYKLYILGQNGELLYTSADLTEGVRSTVNSLAVPICLLNKPVIKIKSLATTNYTGILTFDNSGVVAPGALVSIADVVYKMVAALVDPNDILIEPPVVASAILTSNNNNALDGVVVTVGSRAYTIKTALTEAKSTAKVSSNNVEVNEDETVSIGGVTYRFKAVPTQVNDVTLSGVVDTTLANLIAAVNLSGTEGVEYFAGQQANPLVTAGTVIGHEVIFTNKVVGVIGNSTAKAAMGPHLSWDAGGAGTMFSGGVDAILNEVLVSAVNADGTMTNLRKAINLTGIAGTDYSTGQTIHPDVTCGAVDGNHALTMTAKVAGTSGNSLAKISSDVKLDWDGVGAVFTGGDWGIDATLDNLKNAINAGAGEGVKYGTGTVANPYVTCGAVIAHTITVTAVEGVEDGADVATTETSTKLSWANPTLTGGGEGTAKDFVIDLYIER